VSITLRNFCWDDLPAVVEVMNLSSPDRPKPLSVEDIEPDWRAPYNHPEQDCFVALLPDGSMVGVGIADLLDTPNEANGVMWYLPDYPAVAQMLLQTTDDYFLQTALHKSPSDVTIWMNRYVSDSATEIIHLLEAEGYHLARRFYTMRITLDQPVEPAPIPDGFTLRPIQIERDALPVYLAQREAFQEHWGSQLLQPYHEWLYQTTQPDFDPNLWWVALDGDEIVGMVLGVARNAEYGWISAVGVRPLWRKRGVALAMLQRCLVAFQQRNVTHVELMVDIDNINRALTLYERAGMHIARCQHVYRKALREG
jgi:ribosomal protein S18 acetylase RimI-like enzyme